MSEELLKPAEVCRRLGMPPSTLRIYSTKFAELLSDGAKRPVGGPEGRVGSRVYTSRDLLVLTRAKELLAQGLTYDQTLAELGRTVGGVRPKERDQVAVREAQAGAVRGPGMAEEAGGETVALLVETLRAAIESNERTLEMLRRVEERQEREIFALRESLDRVERNFDELLGEIEKRGGEKGWRQRFFGG